MSVPVALMCPEENPRGVRLFSFFFCFFGGGGCCIFVFQCVFLVLGFVRGKRFHFCHQFRSREFICWRERRKHNQALFVFCFCSSVIYLFCFVRGICKFLFLFFFIIRDNVRREVAPALHSTVFLYLWRISCIVPGVRAKSSLIIVLRVGRN